MAAADGNWKITLISCCLAIEVDSPQRVPPRHPVLALPRVQDVQVIY